MLLSLDGLPNRPAPDLDPLLDAAARCFVRHGVSRTRVPDIAAEMGVSRVTVYRQAGGVDQIAGLLIARDLQRLLEGIPPLDGVEVGPSVVVSVLAGLIEEARQHAVLQKVLRDEPSVIGPLLATELPEIIERASSVLAPLIDLLVAQGAVAPRDTQRIAAWLVRIGITLLVAPVDDLEAFLAEVLVPVLEPADR